MYWVHHILRLNQLKMKEYLNYNNIPTYEEIKWLLFITTRLQLQLKCLGIGNKQEKLYARRNAVILGAHEFEWNTRTWDQKAGSNDGDSLLSIAIFDPNNWLLRSCWLEPFQFLLTLLEIVTENNLNPSN